MSKIMCNVCVHVRVWLDATVLSYVGVITCFGSLLNETALKKMYVKVCKIYDSMINKPRFIVFIFRIGNT
jgi:hypothetical protein